MAAEKQQFIDDQRRRNAVEGKIGRGKPRLGLGLIREKLPETENSSIAMNVLVMNLQKLLKLFLFFFSCWIQLMLGDGQARRQQFGPLGL